MIRLLALTLALAGCTAHRPPRSVEEVRAFTLLTVNDIYRIEGLVEADKGGLARLRALRASLAASDPDLIVLHAGDALFPSLLSRSYKGEQMIDVLNTLDGDDAAFDSRMFFTFGNHEFDAGKLSDAAMLDSRVEGSQFTWLGSNVHFAAGDDGQPLVAADNLKEHTIIQANGVAVGIFSVTINNTVPAYVTGIDDPLETARAETAALRAAGAEVVVALTHLDMARDEALLSTLGAEGPDLIIGGHDHTRQLADVQGRPVYKADADAASANVVQVRVGPEGLTFDQRYVLLDASGPAADPAVDAKVQAWLTRFSAERCGALQLPPTCLGDPLGKTNTLFEAEEDRIRRFETSAGDWIADRALEAFAADGAQVAFVNSGSLRLNQDLPAGATITRKHIDELFAYPAELKLIKIKGSTLAEVAGRSVKEWSGSGHWLQIAGFAYVHDPSAASASALTLLGPGGPRAIGPDDELLAVTVGFLVDPSGGQDGYTMLSPSQVQKSGPDLRDQVLAGLSAAGEAGISPERVGRICNTTEPASLPCLALRDGAR